MSEQTPTQNSPQTTMEQIRTDMKNIILRSDQNKNLSSFTSFIPIIFLFLLLLLIPASTIGWEYLSTWKTKSGPVKKISSKKKLD